MSTPTLSSRPASSSVCRRRRTVWRTIGLCSLQETRRESLPKRLLLKESERAKAAVGEEGVARQARVAAAASRTAHPRSPGGSGIAQPLPGVSFVQRESRLPLPMGSAFRQSAQRPNSSRPSTKSAPAFRMRSRSQSSRTSVWIGVAVPSRRFFVRGPMRSMKSSRLFGSFLVLPKPAAATRLVRFVEDDRAVLAFQQDAGVRRSRGRSGRWRRWRSGTGSARCLPAPRVLMM